MLTSDNPPYQNAQPQVRGVFYDLIGESYGLHAQAWPRER
jgi:hypothetical protein